MTKIEKSVTNSILNVIGIAGVRITNLDDGKKDLTLILLYVEPATSVSNAAEKFDAK